jgi:hypothetical protein
VRRGPGQIPSARGGRDVSYRRARKQLRSSVTNRPGCSKAAKWPPLGMVSYQ